jgi:hypothetical protein
MMEFQPGWPRPERVLDNDRTVARIDDQLIRNFAELQNTQPYARVATQAQVGTLVPNSEAILYDALGYQITVKLWGARACLLTLQMENTVVRLHELRVGDGLNSKLSTTNLTGLHPAMPQI